MEMTAFSPRTEELLRQAVSLCERREARLTEQRRQVLGLILESQKPLGAYDLLDRMRVAGAGSVAPPTVYRALEFLQAQGLVHKLERLSAFIGCTHAMEPHAHEGHDHAHGAAQFLICARCGRTTEINDTGVMEAVRAAARGQGFAPRAATVEVEGVCEVCAEAESVTL